jgi:acetaldehyde dehydrogenase
MRTTITVNGKGGDPIKIKSSIENTVDHLKKFVPGIELIYYHFNSRLSTYTVSVLINGQGIYLPEFAGNLDIINIAAVETAKKIAYQQGS